MSEEKERPANARDVAVEKQTPGADQPGVRQSTVDQENAINAAVVAAQV